MILCSIWLFSRWLSIRDQVLRWLSFRNPEKNRNAYLFDMTPDCRFDMTAPFFHACGVFRLSAVWYNGNASVQSVSNIVQSAEKVSAPLDSLFDMMKGFSFRYDGVDMTIVSKWHTAPVDCESVRGSQIFCPEIFVLKVGFHFRRFVTKTDESLAIWFYGREFGYTRLWSKDWLCPPWRKSRIEVRSARKAFIPRSACGFHL